MHRTDYEALEQRDGDSKRLLRQEELLVDVQEEIPIRVLVDPVASISKAELAKRLGKSRPFVTQVLNSGRNLTLRTWADIATSLGHRVTARMIKDTPGVERGSTADGVGKVEIVGSILTPEITPESQTLEIDS